MDYYSVLKKLEDNEISAADALKELYPIKKARMGKKAYFIKMRINIPEEGKGVNRLLKFLFFIPFPIVFANMALRFANRFIKEDNIDLKEIAKILKYSKKSRINIDSTDAHVDIKII